MTRRFHPTRSARMGRITHLGLGLLAVLVLSMAPLAAGGETTERWYELEVGGQKAGYFQVVWAPSTWEGRKTLHDTTTQVRKSVRNMSGIMDVFETTFTVDIERDADGTLWWQRVRVEEGDRVTTEELTWTGKGYRNVARLGTEMPKVTEVDLDGPVKLDAESVLGHRFREGKLAVGDTLELPLLNLRAKRVDVHTLEVVAKEDVEDEHGKAIPCLKVKDTHPTTKAVTWIWMDADGAFVRIKDDQGMSIRRVLKDVAVKMPVKPAEMRITTPSYPSLERVFSADRLRVDLHLQGDADRSLPEFPESPWSKPLSVKGSDEDGWVVELALRKYDSTAESATIPVADEAFEKDLEATLLMQVDHPRVQAMAKEVVGDETDARRAAHKLARHVIEYLANKSSPDVAQASALEIIDLRCGDCSEHCLLFVTLCRAAGIPARRCSGYVNIGSVWGAHAWCEIWTGQWIGADPTTGEIGTGARYLFFGYSDREDSYPGVVSSRARGRMRFVATSVGEGEADYDLTDDDGLRIHDKLKRRYIHVLSGLEMRAVPEGWQVSLSGSGSMRVRTPEGMIATLRASADQGYTYEYWNQPGRIGGFVPTTFGRAPALVTRSGNGDDRAYRIFSRRRAIYLRVRGATTAGLAQLERCLTPGLQAVPTPWHEPHPIEKQAEAEPEAQPEEDGAEGEAEGDEGE